MLPEDDLNFIPDINFEDLQEVLPEPLLKSILSPISSEMADSDYESMESPESVLDVSVDLDTSSLTELFPDLI
ncbi:hypothetical protein HDE_03514 [Halotydeus destructor]|nr:hypothetical protein HDE_03514 [Halotydeus destructor]